MADSLALNADEKDASKIVAVVRQLVERFQPAEDTASSALQSPVVNADLANMAQATAKGRAAGAGTGAPSDLTAQQILDIINTLTVILITTGSGGGEGGEVHLLKPPSGSSLSGDVAVDINTNSFRVFDTGGTNKGFNIDLTACAAGAGTSLLPTTSTQPTRQYLTSGTAATYTTPANCTKIIIKMIGGGGGGGAATTNAGATGTTTTFNSINANGGNGGTQGSASTNTNGGTGGSGGTGSASLRLVGSAGGYGFGTLAIGGFGAPGIFGSGGTRSTLGVGGGSTAAANTGAGGSGGSAGAATGEGGGGGGGEYVEFIISSPAATYTYTVGGGGAGGSAGSQAGGNGGSGLIIVEEYY